jgi:cytoskeletal protein CcmA (bactofilin family)
MQELDHSGMEPASQPATPANSCAGGTLVLVMVIVIAISLIGIVLMSMGDFNGLGVVRGQQADQAFSLAEGGLYHAIARLRTDGAYRNDPTPPPITTNVGPGCYTTSVWRLDDASISTYFLFSITSMAHVASASRVLTRNVEINIYQPRDALISGGYISLQGTNGVINGNIVAAGYIATCETVTNGTLTSSNSVFIGANVEVYSNITAAGSVVVSNGATVNGAITSGVNVAVLTNVTVNGNVTAGLNVTNRAVINGDVTAMSNVYFSSYATNNGDIIAGRNVTLTNRTTVNGDVTAGRTANVSSNSTVTGTTLTNAIGITPPPPVSVDVSTNDWNSEKAYFDSLISIAQTSKITSITFPYSLSNRTVYVNGNVANAVGKPLIGPGTLVVDGSVTLFAVSNGVTVISGGKLQLGTGGTPSTNFPIVNSTFYSGSSDRMWLDNPYLSFSNCVLYSAGDLDARAFDILDAQTVFYALGAMHFGDGRPRTFNIQGQLQAGSFITADRFTDFNVIYVDDLPRDSTVRLRVSVTPVAGSWGDVGY